MRRLLSQVPKPAWPKPDFILFNWKLRLAYVVAGAGIGFWIARITEGPMLALIGFFACVSLLRIALEVRRHDAP